MKVDIYLEVVCLMNFDVADWGVVISARRGAKRWPAATQKQPITALEALEGSCEGRLHTDSKYPCDGITIWIKIGKRRGWKTAKKKPVENADLWRRLKKYRESVK